LINTPEGHPKENFWWENKELFDQTLKAAKQKSNSNMGAPTYPTYSKLAAPPSQKPLTIWG